MKKRIIFASMVAATMIANVTAKAETVSTTKSDSNKIKSTTETNKLLVNGQEKELIKFVNEQAPSLAFVKEVSYVNNILEIYNNNPSALLNLEEAEKLNFNDSVLIFIKKLEELKTKEATNWLLKVKHTSNTIDFLWNLYPIEVQDNNQETNLDTVITVI